MSQQATAPDNRLAPPRWWMICIGLAILASFTTAGWYAGHRSGNIQKRRWNNELIRLTQELSATKLAYEKEKLQLAAATTALHASGRSTVLGQQQQLQRQLLKAQADAETCKEIVDRQQLSLASRLSFLNVLSAPGVRLLPMRGTESAALSVAYVVLVPNKKLIFVGSDLPALSPEQQLQIWIIRKADPKVVSAGMLTPAGRAAVYQFTNTRLMTLPDIASIAVTNEPRGGSTTPTGAKLLVADIPD